MVAVASALVALAIAGVLGSNGWVAAATCGRAYAVAYQAMVAYDNWHKGMDILKKGDTRTSTPFTVPQDHRMGVGFWGAGRGWLTHHVELDKGAIVNYQIITPSTLMAWICGTLSGPVLKLC